MNWEKPEKEIFDKAPKAEVKEFATYGILDSKKHPIYKIDLIPITDVELTKEMEKEIIDKLKESKQGPAINLGAYQLLQQAASLGTPEKVRKLTAICGDILKPVERSDWREKLFSRDQI